MSELGMLGSPRSPYGFLVDNELERLQNVFGVDVAEGVEEITRPTCAIKPERKLLLSLLQQVCEEIVKYRFARRRREQCYFIDAYSYISSDDVVWPYSFVNVCQWLKLDPYYMRERLLR